MNTMLRSILLSTLLCAALPSVASDDFCTPEDSRQVGIFFDSLAVLVEELDASINGRSESVAQWTSEVRAFSRHADPEAMAGVCDLLNRYPSLTLTLEEAQLALNEPELQIALDAQRSMGLRNRSNLPCLSEGAFNAVRIVKFTIAVLEDTLQGICDSLSCFPGICRVCSGLTAVAGLLMPPLEAVQATDQMYCSTAHAERMTEYCTDTNGACAAQPEASGTLFELDPVLRRSVLVALDNLSIDVATEQTLLETRTYIDDRFDRTRDQIVALDDSIAADADRRHAFQEELRVLDIEAALSSPVDAVPVQLQLPSVFGGNLEETREVVADAINANDDAGIPVGAAIALVAEGDGHFNRGRYLDAFLAYRDAYQELVQ